MNFDADPNGPIPDGNYQARISGYEEKVSTKSGSPYQLWHLELFGNAKVNGRKVSLMTTDGRPDSAGEPLTWGISRLRQLYKAAVGTDLVEGQQFDTDMLMSKEVLVSLAQRQFTGNNGEQKTSSEVKAITPISH